MAYVPLIDLWKKPSYVALDGYGALGAIVPSGARKKLQSELGKRVGVSVDFGSAKGIGHTVGAGSAMVACQAFGVPGPICASVGGEIGGFIGGVIGGLFGADEDAARKAYWKGVSRDRSEAIRSLTSRATRKYLDVLDRLQDAHTQLELPGVYGYADAARDLRGHGVWFAGDRLTPQMQKAFENERETQEHLLKARPWSAMALAFAEVQAKRVRPTLRATDWDGRTVNVPAPPWGGNQDVEDLLHVMVGSGRQRKQWIQEGRWAPLYAELVRLQEHAPQADTPDYLHSRLYFATVVVRAWLTVLFRAEAQVLAAMTVDSAAAKWEELVTERAEEAGRAAEEKQLGSQLVELERRRSELESAVAKGARVATQEREQLARASSQLRSDLRRATARRREAQRDIERTRKRMKDLKRKSRRRQRLQRAAMIQWGLGAGALAAAYLLWKRTKGRS